MSADALKESLSEFDVEQQRMLLALGIILARVKNLSPEDCDELYSMFTEYRQAESEEDRRAADTGIMEILDQNVVAVKAMTFGGDKAPPLKLKKWLDWVSKKIHDLREQANLSQDELEALTGLPQSHISRLENGKHSPSRYTLEKLADAMGVDVSEFDPTVD